MYRALRHDPSRTPGKALRLGEEKLDKVRRLLQEARLELGDVAELLRQAGSDASPLHSLHAHLVRAGSLAEWRGRCPPEDSTRVEFVTEILEGGLGNSQDRGL